MKPDFTRVTKEQKMFIAKKILQLGTISAVMTFYSPNPKGKDQTLSLVDLYARQLASKLLSESSGDAQ